MYTSVLSALERVVKTEDKYGIKHCSGSALLSTGSIIKHSLNNGAVLTNASMGVVRYVMI